MPHELVQVVNLRKSYPTGGGKTLEVLRGVDLNIRSGEIVAVVGESGTGKSTLLHIIGALDRPSSGTVYFENEDLFKKSDDQLARFRNQSIGFIFQFHHLLPEFSALENVAMPALIRNQAVEKVRSRARELLETLGLQDRAEHRPAQLSGGEQQRVAVARALMNNPSLILADEPTGNLDTRTADVLHEEIVRLSRTLGQTFVLVTHNLNLAERADRILSLKDGILKPANDLRPYSDAKN